MKHDNFSRRGFLKGALATAGAASVGLVGEGVARAQVAGQTSHLVHLILPGGYNGLFAGCADKFVGRFGATAANIKNLGNGVFTDAATLGTLPDFALQHWAGVGVRHGNTAHLGNGAERALLFDGTNSYLNRLAHAMGGDAPIKSAHFGDRMPYGPQPAYQGVSLQRITDLGEAIKALGAAGTPDPNAPDRGLSAAALEAAQKISRPHVEANPRSLTSVSDAYGAGIAAMQKPPPKPVTFAEISTAYGLANATAVRGLNSMLAGAEIMIRAAGTNVINICDPGFVLWDFHQLANGASRNGEFTRNKFNGTGGRTPIVQHLRTFCNRMLNLPDKNVVLVISGDFVRLINGDHGDGVVATVLGKRVKPGISFGCDGNARFAAQTPGSRGFWSCMASILGAAENPFGANPHPIIAA